MPKYIFFLYFIGLRCCGNHFSTNIASVKKRLMLELEYLCVIKLSDQEYKMIELLNQRASFRGQIDYESEQFSYKYNRKQYQAIQSIDSEI